MRCRDCNRFSPSTPDNVSADDYGDELELRCELVCDECGSALAEWSLAVEMPPEPLARVRCTHEAKATEPDSLDLSIDAEAEAEAVEVDENAGQTTAAGKPRKPRFVPGVMIRAWGRISCGCGCDAAEEWEIEHEVARSDFDALG
jgi:hypothetical protein